MSDIDLRLGDCRDILPQLQDNSVDMIFTDPPYLDSNGWIWPFLGEQGSRLLKPGMSLVTFCGHYNIAEVIHGLSMFGLRYWWIAGMRHTRTRRLPGKWVTAMWKPVIWMVKDYRRGTRTPYDMFEGGGDEKEYHKWQKPLKWCMHWIENLTEPGELVLDPFVGSGTTCLASAQMGRDSIGVEIDEDCFLVAQRRISESGLQPLFESLI